jgi:hypothetical protein
MADIIFVLLKIPGIFEIFPPFVSLHPKYTPMILLLLSENNLLQIQNEMNS